MNFIKDNLTEAFVIFGIVFVSWGLFLISPIIGFIGTGIMFLVLAYLLIKIGGG